MDLDVLNDYVKASLSAARARFVLTAKTEESDHGSPNAA